MSEVDDYTAVYSTGKAYAEGAEFPNPTAATTHAVSYKKFVVEGKALFEKDATF